MSTGSISAAAPTTFRLGYDATVIAQVRANFEQLIGLWQRTRNHMERAA